VSHLEQFKTLKILNDYATKNNLKLNIYGIICPIKESEDTK
jgi:hypothetical protein